MSARLVRIAARDIKPVSQQNRRGVSVGDLLELRNGAIGVVRKLDLKARAVFAEPVAATREGVDKAFKAFSAFNGKAPTRTAIVKAPKLSGSLWSLGHVTFIGYEAKHRGKRISLVHHFNPNARPHLASSHDGRTLVILGGGFRVSDRGIVG